MRVFLLFFGVSLLILACNRSSRNSVVHQTNYEKVEKQIVRLEDTLHYAYKQLMNNSVDTLPFNTIHLLESHYKRAFNIGAKKEMTSIYLDRLQQLYMQEKKYALSLAWTDTLLYHFPKYKQKAALLLNAATTSEVFLKDVKKTQYYYNRLLNEHPKLKKEVVEMVKMRLGKS